MQFTQRAAEVATASINSILCPMLDEAIAAKAKADYDATRGSGEGEVAAKRIGAGYIGTECARDLAFRYHRHPKEDRTSSVNKGELQRHAESGHWTEAKTAEWLRLVGFQIETFQKDKETGQALIDPWGKPKQIGWKAARNQQTGQYRMAGEVDGVIVGINPPESQLWKALKPPALWESKKATDKKWKKFSKETVKKADPRYYGQLQANMAYMGVAQTLFSMLNLDTMKYYFEVVAFDATEAQRISDRAVQILESDHAFQMPRLGRSEDDHVCKFCDFARVCWSGQIVLPPALGPGSNAQESVVKAQEAVTGERRPVFNPNWGPK